MSVSSLFNLCVQGIASDINKYLNEFPSIPGNVILEIYLKLSQTKQYHILLAELQNLSKFMKILAVNGKRHKVHILFKTFSNLESWEADWRPPPLYDSGEPKCFLGHRLANAYASECVKEFLNSHLRIYLIRVGLELGGFLSDAGWFKESSRVLQQCMFVCLSVNDNESFLQALDCLQRLLISQGSFCMFQEARTSFETAKIVIEKLRGVGLMPNLAGIYCAFSALCFAESRYNESLEWSVKALKEVRSSKNPRQIVDVLRQCSKSCVVKREFEKAELVITEAVYIARDVFGPKSVKYADALLDYGFYLLNRDSVPHAVTVYTEALKIRKDAFGECNLMTAIAYEDAAYALYVKEYSTGKFTIARTYADKAIEIMKMLLPDDHLQYASAKRVKALILEEVAIDNPGGSCEEMYLFEAQNLHLSALKLSTQVFGEMNVQTAKHYGNLGRLYQSMKKYQDAEDMHLKAISIKEKLLGLYDYEVALSVGHLASLYNYDMMQFKKAEQLHLRSIQIARKLFGDAYSGLEYDYRGLLQVYAMEGYADKIAEYNVILNEWKHLRDLKSIKHEEETVPSSQKSRNISEIVEEFMRMNWLHGFYDVE